MNSACVLFFVAGIIMLVFGIAGRGIDPPNKNRRFIGACFLVRTYITLHCPPRIASGIQLGSVDGMIRDLGRRDTQVL